MRAYRGCKVRRLIRGHTVCRDACSLAPFAFLLVSLAVLTRFLSSRRFVSRMRSCCLES